MKKISVLLIALFIVGCSTPARVMLPANKVVASGIDELDQIALVPAAQELVREGDTLRIVRDAGQMPTLSAFNVSTIYELTLFTVMNDGYINYPHIGRVEAARKTPAVIAADITERQKAIYRKPEVTVNINNAPGNTVFVGGAVRNPSAVPIPMANNILQAIMGAGGVNALADSRKVALLREDSEGVYHTYFLDYSKMLLTGEQGRKALAMQRGDIVFVPKSAVGERIEGVDVYLNQLIPFAKSIGIGASYTVNR